jgi:hypothetical protein
MKPEPPERGWYVKGREDAVGTFGPFTSVQVRRMFANGGITAKCWVTQDSPFCWEPITQVPFLIPDSILREKFPRLYARGS